MKVPVERAADHAKPGTGVVTISEEDPCLVIGHGTKFKTEIQPKWKILLPRYLNSPIGEVVEIISDTELRIKKEFSGEKGKATAQILEKLDEFKESGKEGLEYKWIPVLNQQDMYRFVYQRLKEGGCIGIFPEGEISLKPSP